MSFESIHEARIAWLEVVDPADTCARSLLRKHGPIEALRQLSKQKSFRRRLETVEPQQITYEASRVGARLITPEGSAWPVQLSRLPDAPAALWVTGPSVSLLGSLVAVTGARAATSYGMRVARDLSAVWARERTICTGLSYGIENAAVEGLMASGTEHGPVIVMASGPGNVHPVMQQKMYEKILDLGATVVSVSNPGSVISRQRLHSRLRVMAALATQAVVVEAARKSSTFIFADAATMCGVPLAAVPGQITSVLSQGCFRLISQGASLITSPADLEHVQR